MAHAIILGLAGAAGTLSRYFLGGWVHQILGHGFPHGTLAVNVLGCIAIGFLGTLAEERSLFNPQLRTILILGFLGAFTTFSSFAYETWILMKSGTWLLAGTNVALSLIACFAGLFIGIFLARII
ncbi:MAG: fluoride efflux transporter CrcB [Deltaproteobacteria bacterium]|nr:fluoride efflux transporter CrcB [Deltaproteobacteria bacterium]